MRLRASARISCDSSLRAVIPESRIHDSGPKRQTGSTDTLVVSLLFSRDIGVDLLFVRMIEGESGIDLSKRERRTIRCDLLRSEPPVALDRDRSHANARSGDDGPADAQCRVARD